MGVLVELGMVIPIFIKDIPNFVEDVLRVLKCVSKWGWAYHR